jgi:hypothetical protein
MFQVTLDLDWPEFQKKLVKNLDWLMFRLTKEKFSQNKVKTHSVFSFKKKKGIILTSL